MHIWNVKDQRKQCRPQDSLDGAFLSKLWLAYIVSQLRVKTVNLHLTCGQSMKDYVCHWSGYIDCSADCSRYRHGIQKNIHW